MENFIFRAVINVSIEFRHTLLLQLLIRIRHGIVLISDGLKTMIPSNKCHAISALY